MSTSELRSVVIVRPDRIGDVVLSSSCLAPVRAALPQAQIHWLVQPPLRPLFHRHPAIAGLLSPGTGPLWSRVNDLAAELRRLRPDAIALLQPNRTVELAAWRAGIPIRAGFARPRCWPQFLTHAVPYRKSEGAEPEAAMNFAVLALLGVSQPGKLVAHVTPDPSGRASVHARFGAAVARLPQTAIFHLAAHGQKQRVPLPVFAELAGWLHRECGLTIGLVGLETEPAAAEFAALAGLGADALLDLRGQTDLVETAAVLEQAALCVARDSGPAHLAAALGCPTLTLFPDLRPLAGPTRWTPLGPRVETVAIGEGGFRAEELRAAALRLLAPRGRGTAQRI